MPGRSLMADDTPPTAKELADQQAFTKDLQEQMDYENQLLAAIAQKDDAKIAGMIKDSKFDWAAVAQAGSIITIAVHTRNFKVLDALVKTMADINAIGPLHSTGLIMAVNKNDVEMVRYLLDHGADPFRINPLYETALDRGMEGLDSGIKKSSPDCMTAILEHVKKSGKLDAYLHWEEALSEVRVKGQAVPTDAAKEKGFLLQIQKLAAQIKD